MADRYFVGDTDSSWNDVDNWSTSSGGAGGVSIPTNGDDVFFDANSPDCDIDVNAICLSLDSTGFTNTLTQTSTYTLTVGVNNNANSIITWADGDFAGGSGQITTGFLNITGGEFTSTSGLLFLTYISGGAILTIDNASYFVHNSGEFKYDKSGSWTTDVNGTFFYDFTIDNLNSETTIDFLSDLNVANKLYNKRGRLYAGPGILKCQGDIQLVNIANTNPGTLVIEINGTGAQQLYVDKAGGAGRISRLHINKASGTLTVWDTIELWNNGTAWAWTQGTVDLTTNEATLVIAGYTNVLSDTTTDFWNYKITLKNDSTPQTFSSGVKILNDLTLQDCRVLDGGPIQVGGDLILNEPASMGGTLAITMNGTADQNISGTSMFTPNGTFTIDNQGGSVYVSDEFSLDGSGQDLTVTSGSHLHVNIPHTLNVDDVLTNNGSIHACDDYPVTYGSLVGNAISYDLCASSGSFSAIYKGEHVTVVKSITEECGFSTNTIYVDDAGNLKISKLAVSVETLAISATP